MESTELDDLEEDDGGAAYDEALLGDLKRRLMPGGGKRGRETRPPAASSSGGGMDVHGLPSGGGGGSGTQATRFQDVLATALGGKAAKLAVSKEIRLAQRRNRVLEAPVKLRQAKSERIAAYERAHKDLGRWYGYVERNRLSEAVAFPLPVEGVPRPQSTADYHHRARADIAVATAATADKAGKEAGDDLESRLYRRLYNESAIAQAAKSTASGSDPQQQQQLDGAKVRERLASARRLTARRHFLEEKLKRQARIKSKAYRRHARRAKLKQEVAELEALKDSDPAAFADRLAALERARAEERISQRHRGGSRFARDQKLRARFDDTARQAVQDMLQRGRDLTEKAAETEGTAAAEGSDSDDDEEEANRREAEDAANLPDDLRDEWNQAGGGAAAAATDAIESAEEEDVSVPAALRHGNGGISAAQSPSRLAAPVRQRNLELDLSHLPELASSSADGAHHDGDDADKAVRRLARMRTDELLADDCEGQAVEEFEKEKAEVAEQEQPKDVDLFLPGWNTWTGPGTRPVAPERRQQFLIKAPRQNRRDAHYGHVIIREKLESSAARRRHLVKEVPFPYANAEQFENAMRAPICREFNSILAHKRLTAPKVSVAMGRAIGPVTKDAILRRRRKQRTNADIVKGSSRGVKKRSEAK